MSLAQAMPAAYRVRRQKGDIVKGKRDGARIDDEELTDAGPPLPDEGGKDPLTEGEPTALEEQVDPYTGLPPSREPLR